MRDNIGVEQGDLPIRQLTSTNDTPGVGVLLLASILVAITIIIAEVSLLHSTALSQWVDGSSYLLMHGLVDITIVLLSVWLSLNMGFVLVRRCRVVPHHAIGVASTSAFISVVFTLLTLPLVTLRKWLHPMLDSWFNLSPSAAADPWLCSFVASTTTAPKGADGEAFAGFLAAMHNGLQGALLENAVLLPIVMLGLVLWAFYHHRSELLRRGRRISIWQRDGWKWFASRTTFVGVSGVLCLALMVASGWLQVPVATWKAALVTQTATAQPGTGGMVQENPCNNGSTPREYFVEARDIQMVLNRFGDRDPDAYMYVGGTSRENLTKRWEAIEAQIDRAGCVDWGGANKPHIPCVAAGLGTDPEFGQDMLQPLIMRANLGECVVIHFKNVLTEKVVFIDEEPERRRPDDGKAAFHIHGLAHSAKKPDGTVIVPKDAFASRGEEITYTIPIPRNLNAERAYYFHDGGGYRQRVAHGLFGALIVEPAGAKYLDTRTGEELMDGLGWQAIIKMPDAHPEPHFREFVLIYHEIGDEDFDDIIDGTAVDQQGQPKNDTELPQIFEEFQPKTVLGPLYRISGRAINYRSESFHHRLLINKDTEQLKSLGYSSYTFGDPATPIPRSYLGEPTKTRLLHGGSEVFHVHHLHGGGTRWRRNPKADPNNNISSGLTKRPAQEIVSVHLDSQTIGPGTSYNLEHECGAGGCQQAAGDFLYHCHIGQHYLAGMWGLWRVYDTKQPDLALVPELFAHSNVKPPEEAVSASALLFEHSGRLYNGKKLVRAIQDPATERLITDWVEQQFPPPGVRWVEPQLPPDKNDATVWDWHKVVTSEGIQYLGEPEHEQSWANYQPQTFPHPENRPEIRFNRTNGRYAWPLFRPHLGKRPPFAPNGHTGTPWLPADGKDADGIENADGLCPNLGATIPQQVLHYPITAVEMDIFKYDNNTKDNSGVLIADRRRKIGGGLRAGERAGSTGELFVLNEHIKGQDEEGKVELVNSHEPDYEQSVQPLTIRSHVGDCTRIILTSKLHDVARGAEANQWIKRSKVNIHTHMVQFDPQGSDGVITGFSYEQSIRPYSTEKAETDDGQTNNHLPRVLVKATDADKKTITVNQAYRLRKGIWIGIGLGAGMCGQSDEHGRCDPNVSVENMTRPRTEFRQIQSLSAPEPSTRHVQIELDKPLDLFHKADEAVGVEFVQYSWYSDVDTGTVFWHDHADFNSWDVGLVGAHVIEPVGSTWHDPKTGRQVRSGTIVDIRAPENSLIGVGQRGSFREFVLFHHKTHSEKGAFDTGQASINLKAEPIQLNFREAILLAPPIGRNGEPAHWFSSVKHGDPFTPMPQAYVGDPFVIRHLGVIDRVGGMRVTGHRFRLERWADAGALSDTSPLGISERFDLVLDGGAGGKQGKAGDYLYYNTIGRDMLDGAWGLIRVYNTIQRGPDNQPTLQPLPGRVPPDEPPPGEQKFPFQNAAAGDNSENTPLSADFNRGSCPPGAKELSPLDVHIRKTLIMRGATVANADFFERGVVYSLSGPPEHDNENTVQDPLVLRVNKGECLVVKLTNHLDSLPSNDPRASTGRSGLHIGELLFDPQLAYGAAIGLNVDSSVAPQGGRGTYHFFADVELGTTIALNLANPILAAKGAFAAVVVEPEGSSYRFPKNQNGDPLAGGVLADILDAAGNLLFHEMVTLFHDSDPVIGNNTMEYPTEAHCIGPQGTDDPDMDIPDLGARQTCDGLIFLNDPSSLPWAFTSISYKRNRWRDRGLQDAPADVYSSQHGNPGLVITGMQGDPLTIRVAAPWGEQAHVFSLSGHRWSLEPKMARAEQVFAQFLSPGYSFDALVIGGFGGPYRQTGDSLYLDSQLPFAKAGLWGLIRTQER